tara:strand:- start:41 stop:595 length:555 start_codon:yes stop_codon:yes gene_type:complete
MMDKITALAAPPGNSLTDTPGKWPWEQPPRFTDPDDVIDFTIDTIMGGPIKDDLLKLMMAGITVEELVTQISFKGFLEGQFTPDVAELIKPAIGIFLVDLALQTGFEPKMFVDSAPVEGDVTDENFFEILKENNPKLFAGMVEEMNKEQRENIKRTEELTAALREEPAKEARVRQESFLGVEEQ